MNASDVLDLANASGVSLQFVAPETVRIVAPKGTITDELRQHVKTCKTDLIVLLARIAAFTARPCASCGGYDYTFAEDGHLICPCYFAKVEESKKPRPPLSSMDLSEKSRGLAGRCSQCKAPAVWYGEGATAYCDRCWQAKKVAGRHAEVEVA